MEAAAPDIVVMLEEADRLAEIRHQEWLVDDARRKRAEVRKRIEQSIADSPADLASVIERWSKAVAIEQFLQGVE